MCQEQPPPEVDNTLPTDKCANYNYNYNYNTLPTAHTRTQQSITRLIIIISRRHHPAAAAAAASVATAAVRHCAAAALSLASIAPRISCQWTL